MGRIMAIDYGDARTGLAVSDRDGILCGEAVTIEEWNAERLAGRVADFARERDVEKLVLIKEKIGRKVLTMKDKDKYVGNGRQLMIVLDQMLTQKEGRISRSRDLCEEILDCASFTLSRIQATCRLAALEYQSGAGRSAMEHAAYVIDDGGKTFYVDRAREIYKKCCGQDYVTEREQFEANLAAGKYDEEDARSEEA